MNFHFVWGSAPRPHWGSLQRSPRLLAGFKGPTFNGKGRGKERPKVEEGNGPVEGGRGRHTAAASGPICS